jgi:hypothetical protein
MRWASSGQVHEIEIDGERGGGSTGGVGGQRRDVVGEALRRLRVSASTRLGQGTDPLLGLEEGHRLLAAQHVAERLAEQMDASREIHDPNSSHVPTTRCRVSTVRARGGGKCRGRRCRASAGREINSPAGPVKSSSLPQPAARPHHLAVER